MVFMPLKYTNGQGTTLDLSTWPYVIQSENLFDYAWNYDAKTTGRRGGIVTNINRPVTSKEVELAIHAASEAEFVAALNTFFETTEKDVLANKPGRLSLPNGEYLSGYFTGGKNTRWSQGIRTNIKGLTFVSSYPFWCLDVEQQFRGNEGESSGYQWLDYSYDYAYDYTPPSIGAYLRNDHFAECDFEMRIYGPATNPSVEIGGQVYAANVTIGSNEFLIINSRDKTVTRYKQNGERVNEFNNRHSGIFTPMPPGASFVQKGDVAQVDVVLFQERSEPKWTSY